MTEIVQAELPQAVSWAAESAKPSAATPISVVAPPVPVFEPPFRIWYRGPVYVLKRRRTVLWAATHGKPAAA